MMAFDVRPCTPQDLETMFAIVNDAAAAYRGVIPPDRYHEPYMPRDELEAELAAGVAFLGFEVDGELQAVMGCQERGEVTLIRHAYTRTAHQGRGYGSVLIDAIRRQATRPLLVGTWLAATWAIAFYRRHGFTVLDRPQTTALLKRFWTIPVRQVETSVVLADDVDAIAGIIAAAARLE